jgi:hypothetical protein
MRNITDTFNVANINGKFILIHDWSVSRGMVKLFYKMLIIVFVIARFWRYITRVDHSVS